MSRHATATRTITPPIRTPEYLWLLEAFTRFRLDTGCSYAFALSEFQHLYPGIPVERRLEQAARELLEVMAPVYAAKADREIPNQGSRRRTA